MVKMIRSSFLHSNRTGRWLVVPVGRVGVFRILEGHPTISVGRKTVVGREVVGEVQTLKRNRLPRVSWSTRGDLNVTISTDT